MTNGKTDWLKLFSCLLAVTAVVLAVLVLDKVYKCCKKNNSNNNSNSSNKKGNPINHKKKPRHKIDPNTNQRCALPGPVGPVSVPCCDGSVSWTYNGEEYCLSNNTGECVGNHEASCKQAFCGQACWGPGIDPNQCQQECTEACRRAPKYTGNNCS